MFTLYEKALKERRIIDERIHRLEKNLSGLPDGKLICNRNGKSYKWYHSTGGKYKYILKSDIKFAKALALKTYYSLQLEDLLNEKEALEKYISTHNEKSFTRELLANNSEFRKLLSEYFSPTNEELKRWAREPFEGNPYSKDELVHKCESGHIVRSKSEAIIDSLLHENNIPFRYEAPLKLGKHIIYPDFTIRHPITGEFYYWEHCGMMDDARYSGKAFSKMKLYNSNGILPMEHLIMTFENEKDGFNVDRVKKLIKEYFL